MIIGIRGIEYVKTKFQ